MKLPNAWTSAFLLTTLIFAQTASAITPAEEVDKKCIKPKFRNFAPEPKAEVLPASEISFHMNRIGDPAHVIVTAKKIPMKVEVIDKNNFYFIKAKLPEELTNEFARIHIEARSTEGDCSGQDGWLIKITGDQAAETATANQQEAEEPVDKPEAVTQSAE